MAPTSEERREVAARLRKTHGIMAFVEVLGIDFDSDWHWTDVSRRVADLIDPTCHIEDDDWASQQCMGPMREGFPCDKRNVPVLSILRGKVGKRQWLA